MSATTATTNVLITGANRGIGRALTEAFLSRPHHSVVASVRDLEATSLRDIKPAEGSSLHLVKIEATSATDPAEAVGKLKEAGIDRLDLVIVNVGINPPEAFADVHNMDPEALHHLIDVNAVSFIHLFKAVHPLLLEASSSGAGSPKLLAISSNGGQLIGMEPTIPVKVGAYGASKALLNYLVRRAHFENPWLVCWLMNPGFVQTDSGNTNARIWGMERAPHALEDVVPGLVANIDSATRAETSGNFLNFDGSPLTF